MLWSLLPGSLGNGDFIGAQVWIKIGCPPDHWPFWDSKPTTWLTGREIRILTIKPPLPWQTTAVAQDKNAQILFIYVKTYKYMYWE